MQLLLGPAGGLTLLLAASVAGPAAALDNGFSTPALGWSSWYASPSGSQVSQRAAADRVGARGQGLRLRECGRGLAQGPPRGAPPLYSFT